MRAIFLDRDGVINENRADHVKSWGEFQFLPGALEALKLLTESEFHVFVVTNQAMINRGLAATGALERIHREMVRAVRRAGGEIHAVYYCPHREDEHCLCRKPKPGMLLRAAAEWNVDLSRASMVGDALSDVRAGHAAGCRAVLVRTGRGRAQADLPEAQSVRPEFIADDLLGAVRWVLQQQLVAETQYESRHTPLAREVAV
jgi:D-glycero-D-manno-heptose 1,7-bisphosphate phosphatase